MFNRIVQKVLIWLSCSNSVSARQRLYAFREVVSNFWPSVKMVRTLTWDDSSAGVNG
jgi:hypothetical protein